MEGYRADGVTLSLDEKIEAIAAAGYDGISADYVAVEVVRRIHSLTSSGRMTIEGQCNPRTIDDLNPVLEMASEVNTHHLALQPMIRTDSVSECVHLIEGWLRLAEQVAFPVLIETHRGRMTNDISLTLRLMREFPQMGLVADLSHYVVGHEMEWPLSSEADEQIHRILGAAQAFHGRVASSGQVQVELSFPQHRKWVDLFLDWWAYGFCTWRERAAPHDSITFTCELGPPPYAITDRDGRDTTNRWDEALMMAKLVRTRWDATKVVAAGNFVAAGPPS
jgi:hypothetical protein